MADQPAEIASQRQPSSDSQRAGEDEQRDRVSRAADSPTEGLSAAGTGKATVEVRVKSGAMSAIA
jgi:hypothetical protein